MVYNAFDGTPRKARHVQSPVVVGYLRQLGVMLGDWGKITGFLRKDRGNLPAIGYGTLVALFLAAVFLSRSSQSPGQSTPIYFLK